MTQRESAGDVSGKEIRVWDLAGEAADSRHRPRLRFVRGELRRIIFEEATEPGESHVAMASPEIRLSYPYDGANETARTEITIATAECVYFGSGLSEPLIEVDDNLAYISSSLYKADWTCGSERLVHVDALVVDPYWRGGGLGPAFVSLIADGRADVATLEPAPVRTVRQGGRLDAQYYRRAAPDARANVADAWRRAGFAPIDAPPWDGDSPGHNRYWARLEDSALVASARGVLAAARRVAGHPDAYEWHRQRVHSMQRTAKRAATRAQARRGEPLTADEASAKAAEVLYGRMKRLLFGLNGNPGADTILLDGAHLQMRVNWERNRGPVLTVQLARHAQGAPADCDGGTDRGADARGAGDAVADVLKGVGTPVRAQWKAGLPVWCIEHVVVAQREYEVYGVAKAVVTALVGCLGLPAQAVLEAVRGARLGPERWRQPDYRPLESGDGLIEDLRDLELDYLDFVLSSRRSRLHFSPWDSDVPAQFFVIVPDEPASPTAPGQDESDSRVAQGPDARVAQGPDARVAQGPDARVAAAGRFAWPAGDLVALAPIGGFSEELGWYRHTPDGWIPDATIPQRLAARPAERLRPVPEYAVRELDCRNGGPE